MMKLYGMAGQDTPPFPTEATLILNTGNALIKKIESSEDEARREMIAKHIYALSLIGQRNLTSEELSSFLRESYDILSLL